MIVFCAAAAFCSIPITPYVGPRYTYHSAVSSVSPLKRPLLPVVAPLVWPLALSTASSVNCGLFSVRQAKETLGTTSWALATQLLILLLNLTSNQSRKNKPRPELRPNKLCPYSLINYRFYATTSEQLCSQAMPLQCSVTSLREI